MGSGDWNDGMSTVGNKGKGESVWLGFFLYDILNRFIPIMEEYKNNKTDVGAIINRPPFEETTNTQNDKENVGVIFHGDPHNQIVNNEELIVNSEEYKLGELDRIERYKQILDKLKKSLNTRAWDGRWYKRAFMDDGNILGSLQNEECRIDGISQSWATISNAGDNDKKYISMESLENHLVDKENGLIKLLDPPFEKSKLEPGYIKSYLPGTRENGGQYTHGAIWAIIAESMLGFGDKAVELFRMINPIEHSKTRESAQKYKVEPYIIVADIYSHENLAGRGGWSWYTGSSSWMLKLGIEYILGLKIEKGILKLEPCISSEWKEYAISYKYGNSIYNIKVENPNNKNTGVESFTLNGQEIKEKQVKLIDDGRVYDIKIIM